MQTMIGLFNNSENVRKAINKFRSEGFNTIDFSTVMKQMDNTTDKRDATDHHTAKRTSSGAVIGAIIGGIASLISTIAIPGIGGLLNGTPMVFNIPAIALTTSMSILTGAIAGSILYAFTDFGLKRDEQNTSKRDTETGAILLAVPARKGEEMFVEHVFKDFGSYDIKSIEQPFTNSSLEEAEEQFKPLKSDYFNQYASRPYMSNMAGVKGGSAQQDEQENKKSSEKTVRAQKGDVIRIEIE